MNTCLMICVQLIIWLMHKFVIKGRTGYRQAFNGLSIAFLVLWGFEYGFEAFSQFNVWFLLCTVPLTYLLYILSLFIVRTKFSTENLIPFGCFKLKGKMMAAFRNESLRNIYSSTFEELLYRWFLQNALYELTNSAVVSVFVTFLAFFAVHIRKNRPIVQMIDIFSFSLVITVWFYYTVNPLYSIIIHILRNQLVICQKHVFLKNEHDRALKYFKILHERKNTNE